MEERAPVTPRGMETVLGSSAAPDATVDYLGPCDHMLQADLFVENHVITDQVGLGEGTCVPTMEADGMGVTAMHATSAPLVPDTSQTNL